jgi:hypothetical protein
LVPSVSGLITFPVAASVNVNPSNLFYITLTNTTTINNSGTTALTSNTMQSITTFYVNGLTVLPTNIIAYALSILDSTTTLSLGYATYRLYQFYSLLRPASIMAGTSTIIAASFTGNGATYNNVTLDLSILSDLYGSVYGEVIGSNTYNVFSIINGDRLPTYLDGFVLFDVAVTQTANKFNLIMASDNSLSMIPFGNTATLTQTNNKPVYIQGTRPSSTVNGESGIYGMTFNPANTFFSVGNDYKDANPANVRLRPSPSPLNFV